jgi:hypothetical protein
MWKLVLKMLIAVVITTIFIYLFFVMIKITFPLLFWLLPCYFFIASILLAIFLSRNIESKRLILKMLLFRLAVVFLGMVILLAGFAFDRSNILAFTILFIMYYVMFSLFETAIMVKSVNS